MKIKEISRYWNYLTGMNLFSMQVLLPSEGVTVDDLIRNLDETVAFHLSGKKVSVKLPRFKMEYERTLNGDLDALGIKSAFGNADFSNISASVGVAISQVLHKTAIEVNEEGTEAAGVTVITLVGDSGEGGFKQPPVFHVNRPFAFLIKEKHTGAIIFMGVIRNL
jgi:serpin B